MAVQGGAVECGSCEGDAPFEQATTDFLKRVRSLARATVKPHHPAPQTGAVRDCISMYLNVRECTRRSSRGSEAERATESGSTVSTARPLVSVRWQCGKNGSCEQRSPNTGHTTPSRPRFVRWRSEYGSCERNAPPSQKPSVHQPVRGWAVAGRFVRDASFDRVRDCVRAFASSPEPFSTAPPCTATASPPHSTTSAPQTATRLPSRFLRSLAALVHSVIPRTSRRVPSLAVGIRDGARHDLRAGLLHPPKSSYSSR